LPLQARKFEILGKKRKSFLFKKELSIDFDFGKVVKEKEKQF